jgi:hypothetical protein
MVTIEAEAQNARILMASLSAKVDRLQEKSMSDEAMIRELSKRLNDSDQAIRDMGQQLSLRSDRDTLKLQQMLQEVISKQRNVESLKQEQEGQNIVVMEQLNHMRYKMEAYILKTEQVGSDLCVKSRDWVTEAQKGAEAMKAIKDYDQALHSLHTVVDSSADALVRRFDAAQYEIKQKFESEQRTRQQFETNMRDLCSEWRKVVQNQERELIDRVESVRQGLQGYIERESGIRDKAMQALSNQYREFKLKVKDSHTLLTEQLAQQTRSLEDKLLAEKQSNREMEGRLQSSIEEGISFTQSTFNKRLTESIEQNYETKQNMTQVGKALQESILIAEKSTTSKIKGKTLMTKGSRMFCELKLNQEWILMQQ